MCGECERRKVTRQDGSDRLPPTRHRCPWASRQGRQQCLQEGSAALYAQYKQHTRCLRWPRTSARCGADSRDEKVGKIMFVLLRSLGVFLRTLRVLMDGLVRYRFRTCRFFTSDSRTVCSFGITCHDFFVIFRPLTNTKRNRSTLLRRVVSGFRYLGILLAMLTCSPPPLLQVRLQGLLFPRARR